MRAVFDTNILIDYLNGIESAAAELEHYDEHCISQITRIEVLVGAENDDEDQLLRQFFMGFKVKELNGEISDLAVMLRKKYRLKIPDAIVYATARNEGCLLVTRNTKDFKPEWPDVREPYRL